MFGDKPGNLLYVSSSQINVAPPFSIGITPSTTMRVTVNNQSSAPRAVAFTPMAPSLFTSLSDSFQTCTPQPGAAVPSIFVPVVRNPDGSFNSCDHPAAHGSVISLFLNGLGGQLNGNGGIDPWFAPSLRILAQINARSAEVVKVEAENDFVWRIDLRVPGDVRGPGDVVPTAPTLAGIALYVNTSLSALPAGPLTVASFDDGADRASAPWPLYFWVAP
jgi:uncharacterized protein (TIGR03437 family)